MKGRTAMIRTVTGDIDRSQLGITMCHEHFIADLTPVRHDGVSKIETVEEVKPEVKRMMDLGVTSAVEVSTIDLSRDIKKLKQLSEETKLNIVAATGFYLQPFHPAWLKNATAQQICDLFVKELTEGVDDTGIKPGIIAEIASSADGFTEEERKVLIAAGMASCRTGSAVSTHTGRKTAQETIDILLGQGVKPDKVIIGHQDLIDDQEYHLNLLKQGVNIAFDTCGKTAYQPDEVRAKNAKKIIEEGYGDHLVFSNDVSRRTYFVRAGGYGYTGVMSRVVPMMRSINVKEEDIHKILADNPARILDNDWK
jgi:phosphotriesterase-related protein